MLMQLISIVFGKEMGQEVVTQGYAEAECTWLGEFDYRRSAQGYQAFRATPRCYWSSFKVCYENRECYTRDFSFIPPLFRCLFLGYECMT